MSNYVIIPSDDVIYIKSKIELLEKLLTEKSSNPSSDWISTKQAMEILGVGETTLWTYRKQGKISAKKIEKKLYFSRTDLIKLISSNEIKK